MTGPQSLPAGPADRAGIVGVLEAAAAQLRDKGWRREGYGPAGGPNCIMGAVYWAAFQEGAGWMVEAEAETALFSRLHLDPVCWNDHACPDGLTAIDVLLMTAKEVAGAGETAQKGRGGPESAPRASEGRQTPPHPPDAV